MANSCLHCGHAAHADDRFCARCGHALTVTELASPEIYAGFWRRFFASLIDSLIVMGAASLLLSPVGVWLHKHPESLSAWVLGTLLALATILVLPVCTWLYHALLESSHWQATAGKKFLGLKVTNRLGERISFGRASGRYFAKFLSQLTLNIGFLMAAFTARRQALHDIIADTLVVDADADVQAIRDAGPAGPLHTWTMVSVIAAVVLVPLWVLVSAITMIAATVQAVNSDIVYAYEYARDWQDEVAGYWQQNGAFPDNTEQLGFEAMHNLSDHVAQLRIIEGGRIQLTFTGERDIEGATLTLEPLVQNGNALVWRCLRHELPGYYQIEGCIE